MANEPFLKREHTTFCNLFPSIKNLTLIGQEHGAFPDRLSISFERRSMLNYTKSSLPAKIPCSNPRCQQGGYELQWTIDALVRSLEISKEKTFHCGGARRLSPEA
jgi:hypothetical protein